MAEQIGNQQAFTFVHSGGTIDFQSQLRSVTLPFNTDQVDSTAGTTSYREYLNGLTDYTCDVEALYNGVTAPLGTADVKALRRVSGTVNIGFQGSATNAHKITFAANVSSAEIASPYDDVVTINVSFQGSGAPTDGVW